MNQEVEDTSTWKDDIINDDPTQNQRQGGLEEVPERIKEDSDLKYRVKKEIISAIDNGVNRESRIKKLVNKSNYFVERCLRELEEDKVIQKIGSSNGGE